MTIKLNQSFARNGKVDERDVYALKTTLNRLGYYYPYEKTGITTIPDAQLFDALKAFQKDQGLKPTGSAKPGDETIRALNMAASKKPQGHYIWRTVGDARVREEHALLEGEERSWDESPVPGEEHECRCWAVPVDKPEGLTQEVVSKINDKSPKWGNLEFVQHFYFGGGQSKPLSEMGLLGPVIEHAKQIMFDNVLNEVAARAKATQDGPFEDTWSNSYNFQNVVYSLGGATINGRFSGFAQKTGKVIHVEAQAKYNFFDTFTDPASKRQRKIGTSALKDIPYDSSKPVWDPRNIEAGYIAMNTEYGGTAYDITGTWQTEITGSISAE
jgi:hypothetical protein